MIELLDKNIAVTPIFDPDVSPGGIIIPDQAKERCDQGIVKYTGPNCTDIKIGDYVLFSGYTGKMVYLEGEGKLIIFEEQYVVAKIDDVPSTDVPGLYFCDADGEYWTATYEYMFELLGYAMTDAEWRKNFNVKTVR